MTDFLCRSLATLDPLIAQVAWRQRAEALVNGPTVDTSRTHVK
jgi:hypothetical protein